MQPSRGDSLREGSTFPGMHAVGQRNIAYPRGGKITILLLLTSLSLQQNFSQLSPTITEYKKGNVRDFLLSSSDKGRNSFFAESS